MRFVPVGELSVDQRATARQIYETSFPDDLRAPFDGLVADLALAYVDDAERGTVRGFVVLRRMATAGWVFLRYYVVGDRGRGTGSRMWGDLRVELSEAVRVLLDVEDPDEAGIDDAEADERRRRIAFYERLGVQLLPVRSYLPPHDGEPQPLLLLTQNWVPGVVSSPLSDRETRVAVLAVYEDRYGLDADHPVVRRTLEDSDL